jgi:NAD(P)-dependent dehydrogenase (short-subunit alcohol dehydrogenase family)
MRIRHRKELKIEALTLFLICFGERLLSLIWRWMMNGGDSKSAVITGAASGIGRALAVSWARRGWKIGIADIDMEGAERTLGMVEQVGGMGDVFNCDVSKLDDVQAMADHFFAAWGKVDILVNNAGIAVLGFIGDVPAEEWQRVIDINLWGVIYGCHTFIPRMKEQGGGHIVNLASSAGVVCMSEMGPYNITKTSVISLSETLRTELASADIGVTVVCPMFINTEIHNTATCTTEWELEVIQNACGRARMTTEEVALRITKAVDKNRLYLFPQLSAKLFWAIKRISPGGFHWLFANLNRAGWLKPIFYTISRIGWF